MQATEATETAEARSCSKMCPSLLSRFLKRDCIRDKMGTVAVVSSEV